jgi:branched-subunit amino acid ABC-type transport system permease component
MNTDTDTNAKIDTDANLRRDSKAGTGTDANAIVRTDGGTDPSTGTTAGSGPSPSSPSLPERARAWLAGLSPVQQGVGLVICALAALAFVVQPGLFVDQFVGGLVYGMILVMVALGLALVLGLMGVVNFAHGALFMLGAYVAYQFVAVLGLSFWAALVLAPLAVGVVGLVMEIMVLRRLYDQEPVIGLLATFGLTLMIEELVRAIWGAAPLGFPIPAVLSGAIDLGVTQVGTFRLFIVGAAAVSVLAVYALISRTEFGLTVRAGVQDAEMSAFLGVNLPLRFTATFFLGAAIAGVGGVLQAAQFGMGTGMAQQFIILAFVVVVVGGLGSLFGSVLAGLLVGEATYLTPVILNSLASATNLAILDLQGVRGIVPFLVMIVVLLVRPRGLFGEEGFLE